MDQPEQDGVRCEACGQQLSEGDYAAHRNDCTAVDKEVLDMVNRMRSRDGHRAIRCTD